LLQALKLRPTDARAADILGILILGETDPYLKQKVTAALVAAMRAGVGSPGTLRACADLSYRAGDYKAAKECATRALAAGKDSTWHLLELARLAFRDGDSIGGLKLFGIAGAVARDTASRF